MSNRFLKQNGFSKTNTYRISDVTQSLNYIKLHAWTALTWKVKLIGNQWGKFDKSYGGLHESLANQWGIFENEVTGDRSKYVQSANYAI